MDSITEASQNGSSSEAKDIICLAGGAALMIFGAGLAMTHPEIRRNVKALLASVAPDLQEPLRAGVRGIMPDIERYLRLKSM